LADGRGRHLKLTLERQDAIVQKIAAGVHLGPAAVSSGVDESTFWRWMQSGQPRVDLATGYYIEPRPIFREFRKAVTRARGS
jgi:hypothetical protein